jgi:hypothetical protein
MSSIPNNLKYLDSHEWARVESDGTVTIGISDHAQGALVQLTPAGVRLVGPPKPRRAPASPARRPATSTPRPTPR